MIEHSYFNIISGKFGGLKHLVSERNVLTGRVK